MTLAAACTVAQAQTPAKKELINRILKIQEVGISALARGLAEEPAREMLERAGPALAVRVPPERREAVAKEIQADAKKFVDETTPIVRDRALKLAPLTVGTLLDEKFTEDELKQAVGMMESPIYLKFQGLGGEMQRVLIEKVVAETRPQVDTKMRALEESITKRLGITAPAAGAAPATAASAARAPAKK